MNPDYFQTKVIPIGSTPLDNRFPKNNSMPIIDVVAPNIYLLQSRVNRYVTYKSDDKDYWQEPSETVALRTGDCEDYCFLKRAMLIDKGFCEPSDTFLVVGLEKRFGFKATKENLQHHAMLVIRYNGNWLVFDNIAPRVLEDTSFIGAFTPVFSYNSDELEWDNCRKFLHFNKR